MKINTYNRTGVVGNCNATPFGHILSVVESYDPREGPRKDSEAHNTDVPIDVSLGWAVGNAADYCSTKDEPKDADRCYHYTSWHQKYVSNYTSDAPKYG